MSISSSSSPQQWVLMISGLLVVHVIYGTYSVLTGVAMERGIDALFLVYSVNASIFLFLLPFSFALERRYWPKMLRFNLIVRLVLVAFGGVTAVQVLVLMGMQRTSPAIASAITNLSPALIFIIACSFRFEKLEWGCIYSKAKIMGTIISLIGVMVVTLLPNLTSSSTSSSTSEWNFFTIPSLPEGWIIGCIYISSAVFIVSCLIILQASILIEFPAPVSLISFMSLLGSILTVFVQMVEDGRLRVGSSNLSSSVVAFVLGAGAVLGGSFGFQMWCMKKSGPVMTSLFHPVGTVCSAILSAFILRKLPSIGSMIGILIIFIGLYVLLWAKSKEKSTLLDSGPSENIAKIEGDAEESLLN